MFITILRLNDDDFTHSFDIEKSPEKIKSHGMKRSQTLRVYQGCSGRPWKKPDACHLSRLYMQEHKQLTERAHEKSRPDNEAK
jgi:hypothetical protein